MPELRTCTSAAACAPDTLDTTSPCAAAEARAVAEECSAAAGKAGCAHSLPEGVGGSANSSSCTTCRAKARGGVVRDVAPCPQEPWLPMFVDCAEPNSNLPSDVRA